MQSTARSLLTPGRSRIGLRQIPATSIQDCGYSSTDVLTPTDLAEGDTITFEADVVNGSLSDFNSVTVTWAMDGTVVASTSVPLNSGESKSVSADASWSELHSMVGSGTFTVRAEGGALGLECSDLTIEPPENGDGGDNGGDNGGLTGSVSLNGISVPDVQEGQPITASASVTNDTNKTLSYDIFWFVDGATGARDSVSGHAPGQTLDHTSDLGVWDPGSYNVEAIVTNFNEALPEESATVTVNVDSDSDDGGNGGCTSNADCPPGQVCENGTCVQDDSGDDGDDDDDDDNGTTPPPGEPGLSTVHIVLIIALIGVVGYYATQR